MRSSCCCRSAPEFGAQQQQGCNSLVRKTKSQPQSQGKGKSKDKKKGKKGASKSDHGNLSGSSGGDTQDSVKSRSYPNPLSLGGSGAEGTPPPDGANAKHQDLERKTSCPTSPTGKDGDKPKLENKKTAPGALGGSAGVGGGSPKPKRNIFDGLKNTLRPKSKSQDNSSSNSSGGAAITGASSQTSNSATAGGVPRIGGVSSSSQVYANMHSMPELNVAAETGESPETSSGANSHDRKSSGGSVMTSSATQEAETTTSAVSH